MKTRLVCVTDRPLDPRLKNVYWNIQHLQKRGFEFAYFSLATVFGNGHSTERLDGLREFESLAEFRAVLAELNPKIDFIYYHVMQMLEPGAESFRLAELVDRSGIDYCVGLTGLGDMPISYDPLAAESKSPSESELARNSGLAQRIGQILYAARALRSLHGWKLLRPWFWKLQRYLKGSYQMKGPLFWIDRSPSGFQTQYPLMHPRGKRTKTLRTHMHVYDHFLPHREQMMAGALATNDTAIFLGQGFPFIDQYGSVVDVRAETYYPLIREFLDAVQSHTGWNIIKTTHPDVDVNLVKANIRPYQVSQNETMGLVAASMACFAHNSSAICYAVLTRKPVIMLTTDELERLEADRVLNHSIARALGKPVINLNQVNLEELDWDELLRVDEAKYREFIETYIKHPDSEDRYSWDIVLDAIEAHMQGRPQ